jgi:putative ABC transport system permease protein
MDFADILKLALRNLREAKLRAGLTALGIIIGVAVIVTLVSFGLGLQRNTIERFRELDLFTQLTVFGRTLEQMAEDNLDGETAGAEATPTPYETPRGRTDGRNLRLDQKPQVLLDDAAIAAIQKLPGVVAVEPSVTFTAFQRANGRAKQLSVAGAIVPNPSQRFKIFAAGGMFTAPDAAEAVLDYKTLSEFGFRKPEDAIGQELEFLAPDEKAADSKVEEPPPNFMGIPLDIEDDAAGVAVARAFKIVGVTAKPENTAGRIRGFGGSEVYLPLQTARQWRSEHRDEMSEIAAQLARQSGELKDGQSDGYISATVRVTDPAALTDVRNRLKEMGLGSFSIIDNIDEIRNVFLIMNSVLGLLGGISLLVASFGIANTMIMSILERTREIGIMKAIGAEDREIKLIFFVEAAVLGLIGGALGVLAATGLTALANSLAYRFALKPQGASFINFFSLPPWLWLGAILFAVTVAILAALYPASRAAKIDPVKALRHD